MSDLTSQARDDLARHATRSDLAPALWAATAELLERRLALAIEVDAR